MPWTPSQRRLFNAAAYNSHIAGEHGLSGEESKKLADEANKLKKEGREKKPIKKSVIDLKSVFYPE